MEQSGNIRPENLEINQPTTAVDVPEPSRPRKAPTKKTKNDQTLKKRMDQQEDEVRDLREDMLQGFEEMRQMLSGVLQQTAGLTSSTQPAGQNQQDRRVDTVQIGTQGAAQQISERVATRAASGTNQPAREPLVQAVRTDQEGPAGGNTREREQMGETNSAVETRPVVAGKKKKRVVSKDNDRKDLAAFQRLNPRTFAGGDGVAAENWLDSMTKAFDFLDCTDRQRVRFAAYQLADNAHRWWETQKGVFESKKENITWSKFKEVFYEKFFPSTIRIEKAREFAQLKQGSMSVSRYETEFSALIRFSPETAASDEARRKKFEDGLSEGIRSKVQTLRCSSYGQSVDMALNIEKEMEETYRAFEKRRLAELSEGSSSKKQMV